MRKDKIEKMLEAAMTAGEIIEYLEGLPSNAKVIFQADYGDISHTMQALPATGVESLGDLGLQLKKNAYSKSGVALESFDEDEDEEKNDEYSDVILIS